MVQKAAVAAFWNADSAPPGSYDHSRAVQTDLEVRLPCWDFVLVRADHSTLRMKPSWKGTKISCVEGVLATPQIALPAKGIGKSDGKGTFQRYLREQRNMTLRFDPQKGARS